MKKILIVDDEVIILSHLAEALKQMGHEVVGLATTGAEAVSLAKSRKPDLVIMDVVMPGAVDGLTACERIQADLDIPVVLLTSYSDEDILARARKARPYGYILKPFRDEELRASIDLVTDKKNREKNLSRMLDYYRGEALEKGLLFAVFENSPFGALVLDARGGVVYANARFSEITGYTPADVASEADLFRRCFPDVPERKKARAAWGELKKRPGRPTELVLTRKDGVARDMEVLAAALDDGGALLTLFDVTERNQAVRDLRISQEKFRAIADYTPDWESWLGTDGRLLWVSPAVERLTGYSVAECLAMDDYPLPFLYEEDRSEVAGRLKRALAVRSAGFDRRYRMRCKDGETRWIAISWQSIQNESGQWLGLRLSAHDITERKGVEDELVLANVYNRGLFEANPDPLANVDPQGRITDANPAFEAATGLPRDKLLGSRFADRLDDPAKARSVFARVIELGTLRDVELSIRHVSGALTPAVFNLVVFRDPRGEILGVLASGRDASERKRAEALREDIERITRHDLKAPLVSIISVPKVFRDAPNLTDDQREILEELEATGYRMLRMINLSLDLYRMESGTYRFQAADVDLLKVLRAVVGELKGISQPRGCAVRILLAGRPAGDADAFLVKAEALLCHSLFGNLLKNAIEASPQGGVVTIDLGEETPDGARLAAIRMRNRGVIPQDMRSRMFQKYATSGKAHGAGLGAYSARIMTETMQGSVEATSSDQHDSTTVTVRLPR